MAREVIRYVDPLIMEAEDESSVDSPTERPYLI